jgi:fumarate reductase subunit C
VQEKMVCFLGQEKNGMFFGSRKISKIVFLRFTKMGASALVCLITAVFTLIVCILMVVYPPDSWIGWIAYAIGTVVVAIGVVKISIDLVLGAMATKV